jgi:hypothetical protein
MSTMSIAAVRESDHHYRGEAFAHAVARAKADFLEMPGLTLTAVQAARLWGYETDYGEAVLVALEEQGFVVRVRRSAFARAASQ